MLLLTICKFFNCPISGGRYSKSLSAKYSALKVSVKKVFFECIIKYNLKTLKSY